MAEDIPEGSDNYEEEGFGTPKSEAKNNKEPEKPKSNTADS